MITRRVQYEVVKHAVAPLLTNFEAWQTRTKRLIKGKKSKPPFGPPLESVQKLKALMTRHYLEGRYADGAVPVAWVTSGFPVEILRAMGFHTVYPENHAALCGVQRLVPDLSTAAEEAGYSRSVCSYARTDIGSVLTGKTPVGRLPKPDILACCTNICQTVLYWYRSLANEFGVPLVLVDTPFVYRKMRQHDASYVGEQIQELIAAAEKVTGKRFSTEKLVKVLSLSTESTRLWGECLEASRSKPAPWTGIDGFFHIAPIVTMRGSRACNAYYQHLRDELHYRADKGIGGIVKERHRLLWDNLPIWFGVRDLSNQLAQNDFNIVVTTYTNAWAEAGKRMDPQKPYDSINEAYTRILLNENLEQRFALMSRLCEEYSVDGVLLHSDRSCKPYSVGQVDIKDQLAKRLGVKVLLLEADHNDPRAFAQEQATNRLQAFMESFE